MIMLVKFAIDPEALKYAKSATVDSFRENWWGPYGVLADPQGLVSALGRELCELGCNSNYHAERIGKLRYAYNELRKAHDTFEGNGYPLFCKISPIEWQSILGDSDDDLAKYRGEFSLALLDNARADLLGVPNSGTYSRDCGGVEAARFQVDELSMTMNFKTAKRLAGEPIKKGQNTADLWRERFQNLVRCSNGNQQITIVDRYIASNICDNHNELFWLLEHISADSPGCRVTIYSSDSHVSDFAYVKERIDSNLERIGLRKDGIKRLTMFICYDNEFSKSNHDRYIRFGGMICTIGRGIQVFRDAVVKYDTDFSLKSPQHIGDYRDRRERELKNGKRFPHWRWPPS